MDESVERVNEKYVRTQAATYARSGDYLIAARWYAFADDKDKVKEMCEKAFNQLRTVDEYLMATLVNESVGNKDDALHQYMRLLSQQHDEDTKEALKEHIARLENGI